MTKKYYEYLQTGWTIKQITLNTGIKMGYAECGPENGEPILLIHGVTDASISWTQVAPYLEAGGYHCYIVEYRGNGMTDKPDMGKVGYTAQLLAGDILDFIEQLGLEKIHVVGHSFGSLISQVLAVTAPKKFADYTLIDTAVDCRNNPVLQWVKNGDGEGFLGIDNYEAELPEEFLREWGSMTNEDDNFRKATFEHIYHMPMVAWRNLINGLLQFDSSKFIDQIKGRVLVLWGTEDDIFPAADQEEVKKGLAGCDARYVDIDGASHNGFWDSLDMARTYANIILEFIGEK